MSVARGMSVQAAATSVEQVVSAVRAESVGQAELGRVREMSEARAPSVETETSEDRDEEVLAAEVLDLPMAAEWNRTFSIKALATKRAIQPRMQAVAEVEATTAKVEVVAAMEEAARAVVAIA